MRSGINDIPGWSKPAFIKSESSTFLPGLGVLPRTPIGDLLLSIAPCGKHRRELRGGAVAEPTGVAAGT